jgi:hypothetical protein
MTEKPTSGDHRWRRSVRQVLVACVTVMTAASGVVGLSAAPAHAVACPAGAWTYFQARAGGCGHGQFSTGVNRLGQPWFKLKGTVGDDKNDGRCARVEVRIRVRWATDGDESYRACGKGRTAAIDFSDVDAASSLAGSVQAWSVRLCVGDSCTSFIDFRP